MLRWRRAVPILLTVGLACGRLDTPDLAHGAVTGRISGALTGAYAYVLGSPGVYATAAADGTFRLDQVPAGQPRIVMFDGVAGAESVPVQVEGASVSHVELGRPLRAAGAVLVAASPLSGSLPAGLTFTVDGTPLRGVSGEAGSARLFPLPAGTFSISAVQPGFLAKRVDVDVAEGASAALELDLEVDAGDDRRGCVSCGCEHGLACDPADGRCYQCVTNADCGANGTCTAAHVCGYPPGSGQTCEACTSAADCQVQGAKCVNPTGGHFTGYCSQACSGTQTCPSGYDCQDSVCAVLVSCLEVTVTYGGTCTEDHNCQAALKDGKCFPLDRPDGVAGYCSAKVQAGCPAGFGADPGGSGYCAKKP